MKILILLSLVINVINVIYASVDEVLIHQKQLNPVEFVEKQNTALPNKHTEKRTIAQPTWAKHVAIHPPSGLKYLLGYSPVDLKVVPVLRTKPHGGLKTALFKPPGIIHHDGWKPIVHHHHHHHHHMVPTKQLVPVVPAKQIVPIVPAKPVLPAVQPHHLHNLQHAGVPIVVPSTHLHNVDHLNQHLHQHGVVEAHLHAVEPHVNVVHSSTVQQYHPHLVAQHHLQHPAEPHLHAVDPHLHTVEPHLHPVEPHLHHTHLHPVEPHLHGVFAQPPHLHAIKTPLLHPVEATHLHPAEPHVVQSPFIVGQSHLHGVTSHLHGTAVEPHNFHGVIAQQSHLHAVEHLHQQPYLQSSVESPHVHVIEEPAHIWSQHHAAVAQPHLHAVEPHLHNFVTQPHLHTVEPAHHIVAQQHLHAFKPHLHTAVEQPSQYPVQQQQHQQHVDVVDQPEHFDILGNLFGAEPDTAAKPVFYAQHSGNDGEQQHHAYAQHINTDHSHVYVQQHQQHLVGGSVTTLNQPGETDLQIPEHLPQHHQGYQVNEQQEQQQQHLDGGEGYVRRNG